MKTHIRKNGFETNSSSLHGFKLSPGDVVAVPFSPEELRNGAVPLESASYACDWRRYYSSAAKINYLLIQVLTLAGLIDADYADEPSDEPAQLLLDVYGDCRDAALLARVVKAYTGCDLYIPVGYGGSVAHPSKLVGLELFDDEATLHQFIFSPDSYIETGTDNGGRPWLIDTDRGTEPYFTTVAALPPGLMPVGLITLPGYCEGFATEAGGLVLEANMPQLYAATFAGVLSSARWVVQAANSEACRTTPAADEIRAYTAVSLGAAQVGLRLLKDFTVEQITSHDGGYSATGSFTVHVPPAIAAELNALDPTGYGHYRATYRN